MYSNNFCSHHNYSLYFEKADHKKIISESFSSRSDANQKMYNLLGKYSLKINKIYDDKHDKTYFCQDGSVFHINRV